MKANNRYIQKLKTLTIKSNKANYNNYNTILKSSKDNFDFFSSKPNLTLYFLLKGLEIELERKNHTSMDSLEVVDNYLDGHNFTYEIIGFADLMKQFKDLPFIIAFSLIDNIQDVVKNQSLFIKILTYLFNTGIENVGNIDDFSDISKNHPIFRDLEIEVGNQIKTKQNFSFVFDGSNISRCRSGNKDCTIQDVIDCRNTIVELGIPKKEIYIVFGAGVRHHVEQNEVSIYEDLLKEKNVTQAPAGRDDDGFIIQFAERHNAFIVTNDNFRNHKKKNSDLKEFLDEKTIKYSVMGGEIFIEPDDLGKIKEYIVSMLPK